MNPFQMGGGNWRNPPVKAKPKNTAKTIGRMWDYLRLQNTALLIVFISTAVSSALTLVGRFLLGRAVDGFVLKHDAAGLLRTSGVLLAVYIAGSLVSWVQQYVMVGVSQNTVKAMRQDLFAKFQGLPLRFSTRAHRVI